MENYFKNKTVVVTGAGGTICSCVAIDLAKLGARVALVGRTEEKLLKTLEQIEELGGIAKVYSTDVTKEEQVFDLAKKVLSDFGPCDFLINGAGGNNINAMTTHNEFCMEEMSGDKPLDMRGFFDLKTDDFERVLLTNTMGTVIPIKAFAPQMIKNGGGAIINFASMNSYTPLTKVPAYAMSKAAVVNFTQWLATYFATANIRVNAIAPGFIVNERSKNYLGTVEDGLTKRGEGVIAHTPVGKFGKAGDLLGAVRFLLDDNAASFVTGITLPVDGGFLSHPGI